MIVQIYSLMNVQEAVACAQAGADHIGVLVSRTLDGRYPCEVLPEDAKTIFAALRGLAKRVLISIEPDQEAVLKMTEELQPDILHLCADFHGSPAFRALLRQRCPHTELMARPERRTTGRSIRRSSNRFGSRSLKRAAWMRTMYRRRFVGCTRGALIPVRGQASKKTAGSSAKIWKKCVRSVPGPKRYELQENYLYR